MRKFVKPFIFILIALAILGIIFNFQAVLRQIFIVGIFVLGSYFIYQFIRGRSSSTNQQGYKKAVQQSKKKYGVKNTSKPSALQSQKTVTKDTNHSNGKKKRKHSHLKVIDGEKKGKNDKASL